MILMKLMQVMAWVQTEKNRITSFLLALLMTITMVPGAALAAEEEELSGEIIASVCEVCGSQPCICESGEEPNEPETTICETCGEDPCACPDYVFSVGKNATINLNGFTFIIASVDEPTEDNSSSWVNFDTSDFADVLFRIEAYKIVSETYDGSSTLDSLWYQVKIRKGVPPEGFGDGIWIFQNYLEDSPDLNTLILSEPQPCGICGEYDCTIEHVLCGICGKYDCTIEHVFCDICDEWDCGLKHAYCGVCGDMDCTKEHIYCEICRDFDCGLEHEKPPVEVWKPSAVPVIPQSPQLPDEYEVVLVDGSGTPVTEMVLGWAEQASLSAWSALGEEASYQWQIFINEDGGFWADISGQTGKGLLFSRAMLMSALDASGGTSLRCVTALDGESMTSDAVRVHLDIPEGEAALPGETAPMLFSMAGVQKRVQLLAADTVTITIKYLEAGSFLTDAPEIAVTKPYIATIPSGEPFNQTILAPSRPGYAPFRDMNGDGRICTGDDYYHKDGTFTEDGGPYVSESATEMKLTLTAEETLEDKVYYVYYLPVKVNMGIRCFFQNVDNDDYTEDTSLYVHDKMRTGTIVGEDYLQVCLNEKLTAQGRGPLVGFTRMVHQSEPVAADGSTVFECYYDREYIMIHFTLNGGFGVEPIYARYETPVSVPEPTRPGHTFEGWDLLTTDTNGDGIPDQGDGEEDELTATVPAEELRYAALWEPEPGDSKYTVVYWRENADPEPDGTYEYSYWGSVIHENATAGQIVSGANDVPEEISVTEIDGEPVDERPYFTYNAAMTDKNVEVSGDGTTVVNVYYTRNTYTIRFTGYGKCHITEHTHGTGCNNYLICGYAEEHAHTDACGERVRTCDQEEHTEHTDACLKCTHECDLDCFTLGGNGWYSLREINEPSNPGTSKDGYVYTRGNNYYLKLGDTWYCAYGYFGGSSPTTSITRTCGHHNAACYKDTLHTHTDDCYSYSNCDKTAHTHTDACWRDCTLTVHTHTNSCTQDNGTNIIYVITAKYNAFIGDVWPTYDVLQKNSGHYLNSSGKVVQSATNNNEFRGWSGLVTNQESVSKRVNMTYDLCDTSDGVKTATANYGGTYTYRLFYMFESTDQDNTEEKEADPVTGEARHRYPANNGKWYESDTGYYQELKYSSRDQTFSQKAIMGMDPVTVVTDEENGVYYNWLYYDRNRHVLNFQSIDEILTGFTRTNIMYGEDLAKYEPTGEIPYPTGKLEAGGYYFDGWYYTTDFLEEMKVDFTKDTMPDGDLTLQAKWSPRTHTVRFFRHYEYLEEWENTPEGAERDALTAELIANGGMIESTASHGGLVNEEVAEKVLAWTYHLGNDTTAELFGFFYMEDGQKKAYSPQDIPVRGDMNVYAEWRGEAEYPYRIEYVLASDGTPVAEDTKGYFRLGVLHTFFAKAGNPHNQLYDAYNSGYFPLTSSHSMVVQAEENKDMAVKNVHQFKYAPVTKVTYKVQYVDKVTGVPIPGLDTKTVSTEDAVVTESYVPVAGYVPDAFYKQLVLSVKEDPVGSGNYVGDDEANVIIFEYKKNVTDAPYAVHHMVQKLNGSSTDYAGGYEEYDVPDEGIETIGKTLSIVPRNIVGFTAGKGLYLASPGEAGADSPLTDGKYNLTVTKDGAQLYIFYQRNSYKYTVRYYLENTTTPIDGMPAKTLGPALYGSTATAAAPLYSPDYAYRRVSAESQSVKIGPDETLNEIIFYYTPIQYRVDYIAVPDAGGGFSPASQEVLLSQNFTGAKPVPNANYKFEGWYLDEACTQPVTDEYGTIDAETGKLVPKGRTDTNGDPIAEYTFYAKFELLAKDLTITRTNALPRQVFVYRVVGNGLSIDVTIQGNNSVTITDLPFGEYTVTQLNDWSWRYSDTAEAVKHGTDSTGTVSFGGNALTKWLSGIGNLIRNIFGGT